MRINALLVADLLRHDEIMAAAADFKKLLTTFHFPLSPFALGY
jgi:hypothetical protein